MSYKNLISADMRKRVFKHVEKTLAVSNRRPAGEITNALLSWERAGEQLSDLENTLGKVKGKRLLDVGSGYGLFLTLSLLKGAKSIGLEPARNRSYTLTSEVSKEILARAGFAKNLVKTGFGEKLPFKDNSFDLVVSFYTLEHVQNVGKVILESTRVLKPGGYIFFEVPNYGSFWEGHYGIVWLPYIPKSIAKYYVKLWGKEGKLLDELQQVNSFTLKKIAKNFPLEITNMGKDLFKEKVLHLKSDSEGTLGSAFKIIGLLKRLGVLTFFISLANFINAQTPIVFVARKTYEK